jgi:hypothetical protein
MTGFTIDPEVTQGMMALGVVGVMVLACLMWIGASVLRSARHILGVRRRYSGLMKKHAELERDLTTVRYSIRQEEVALRKAEELLNQRRQEVAVAEERLRNTRTTCVRVYQVLVERYAEKDRLWLLGNGKNSESNRWAVAAPDAKTATDLVLKKTPGAEKPALEGQL